MLPEDGVLRPENQIFTNTGFDFYEKVDWDTEAGNVSSTNRATEMSLQLFWARQFGKHNLTAMMLYNQNDQKVMSQLRRRYQAL